MSTFPKNAYASDSVNVSVPVGGWSGVDTTFTTFRYMSSRFCARRRMERCRPMYLYRTFVDAQFLCP